MFFAASGLTMADEVQKSTEANKKVKSDDKTQRIGCSHYARKCILIVSQSCCYLLNTVVCYLSNED